MGYEIEEIHQSQEIFSYLLEHHELREENAAALYKAYIELDNVQSLVKSQGEYAMCDVQRYGNVIYLIPKEDNGFLGFSKAQLKKELCRSGATDRDYYLVQFTILTLLLEFYDGQGSSSKTRDYIRVGELQNVISERLKEGVARYSEDEQERQGMAFTEMFECYEALKSDDRGRKQRTTKEGFIYSVLRFMQDQGLVEYIEQDEMVKTTRKLDHFMDWNLLNKNNFARVQAVLGGVPNEQA